MPQEDLERSILVLFAGCIGGDQALAVLRRVSKIVVLEVYPPPTCGSGADVITGLGFDIEAVLERPVSTRRKGCDEQNRQKYPVHPEGLRLARLAAFGRQNLKVDSIRMFRLNDKY